MYSMIGYTISESLIIQKVAMIGNAFGLLQSLSYAVRFEQ
ncbi:hypothetical protein C427_5491 [Paraglaciecola psychrophila 170]|uniref:Uncharacterized protein n=1 Tax=Paraglaciecola psychrophila 170 TaxID=1129794 RepID=M4RY52_9ALTE|nr:hypothetical protein C427_5491 [Paraglaciecola psychrophila 170]